jgi:CO dehydrogenase/acetyl-CoA synthase epsilon subunit
MNKFFIRMIAVIGAVIGLGMAGCDILMGESKPDDDGGTGETTEPTGSKTLVITNIPSEYTQGGSVQIGLFPVGTSLQEAVNQTGIVAEADSGYITLSGSTVTAYLTVPNTSGWWTGSGTYDVYLTVNYSTYYRAQSVSFTSASTSVSQSAFSEVSFKTLVITNTSSADQSGNIQIGIFPVGTTLQTALDQTGIVAEADSGTITVSGNSATALLSVPGTSNRWTGSGTYDIYLIVNNSTYYRAQSVSFTSASTEVARGNFQRALHAGAQVTVTFTEPQDETITLSGSPESGSLTVSVSKSFSAYRWFLDGVTVADETESSLTLDVSGLSPGRHELTVFVTTGDGAEYAKALRFTL